MEELKSNAARPSADPNDQRQVAEPTDERQDRFRKIENRIREEIRKHPDDLGTLSDVATAGGGGEDLGENVTSDDEQGDAA